MAVNVMLVVLGAEDVFMLQQSRDSPNYPKRKEGKRGEALKSLEGLLVGVTINGSSKKKKEKNSLPRTISRVMCVCGGQREREREK